MRWTKSEIDLLLVLLKRYPNRKRKAIAREIVGRNVQSVNGMITRLRERGELPVGKQYSKRKYVKSGKYKKNPTAGVIVPITSDTVWEASVVGICIVLAGLLVGLAIWLQ